MNPKQNSKQINWKILRKQYEIMHFDFDRLATIHNIDQSIIEYFAEENKWRRVVQSEDDLENAKEGMRRLASDHEAQSGARYTDLVDSLLEKCSTIMDAMDDVSIDEAPAYLSMMKDVSDILDKHRPATFDTRGKDKGAGTGGFSIRILSYNGMNGDKRNIGLSGPGDNSGFCVEVGSGDSSETDGATYVAPMISSSPVSEPSPGINGSPVTLAKRQMVFISPSAAKLTGAV